MNRAELISKLNEDLSREYAHWHFYVCAAAAVTGPHRAELAEFFAEAASSEQNHVLEFSRLILALGGTPVTTAAEWPKHGGGQPAQLLNIAYSLEMEVVKNYAKRMDDCQSMMVPKLGGNDVSDADLKWVHAFIEDQLAHSREDAANIEMMLRDF